MIKKLLPFILPILALVAVIFFTHRWYQQKTADELETPEVSAGAVIEELSTTELEALEKLKKGEGNFKKVALESKTGLGEIRYEFKNDKLLLSVSANLPLNQDQIYGLWIKDSGQTDFVFVKNFSATKGGLNLSSALESPKFPLNLQIKDQEKVVLETIIKE